MPPLWVSLFRTLAMVFAVLGVASAAAQLGRKLSREENSRTVWLRRLRDGLTASAVVTAASLGALSLYFYVLR